MLQKHSGIILILIFSIVMIISSNLQNIFSGEKCDQVSSGKTMTEQVLNLALTDASKKKRLFRDLLSDHEYTWIYFFTPDCPACKIVSDNIRAKSDKNLIGFALTTSPFSSTYNSNHHTDISIFRVDPTQASSIGICSVPYLIKFGRHGEILEAISSYKPVLKKIREL